MINLPLLRSVADHDGSIASAIIEPLLSRQPSSTLRVHLEELAKAGLVELDRAIKWRVICRITNKGLEALREE